MKIHFFCFILAAIFSASVVSGQTPPTQILCTPIPTILVSATSTSVCSGFTSTLTAVGANTYTWTGTSFSGSVSQPTIAAAAGTYTVIGTNSAGCTDQITMNIGMAPPLNVTASQSSATTCISSNFPKYSKPVTIDAAGAASYVWLPYDPNMPFGPQVMVRPAASTCYTVVGSTSNCSGTAVVCVNVIPQFSFNVSAPFPVMCRGSQHQLSVANISTLAAGPASAFTYSWTEPLNAPPVSMSSYVSSAVLIFPQNTCTYSVEVYDAMGCAAYSESVTITVVDCTGFTETISKDRHFTLYPNPVKEQLYIRPDLPVSFNLEVINILGEVLIRKDVDPNKTEQQLNTENLSKGIYFLRLNVKGRDPEVIRFIKE